MWRTAIKNMILKMWEADMKHIVLVLSIAALVVLNANFFLMNRYTLVVGQIGGGISMPVVYKMNIHTGQVWRSIGRQDFVKIAYYKKPVYKKPALSAEQLKRLEEIEKQSGIKATAPPQPSPGIWDRIKSLFALVGSALTGGKE